MALETLVSWTPPLALGMIAVYLFYVYCTWTHSTWSQLGIPGPRPVPVFGNIGEIKAKGMFDVTLKWSKQYGKVCGFYLMGDPVLMTTDLGILKEVFIKDVNNFLTRAPTPRVLGYPSNATLPFVDGATWRRQRHAMAPTFSTSKLKRMTDFISRCCLNLSDAVHTLAVENKPMDIKKVFGAFTLDVIAGTGFGLETNSLVEIDNDFLKRVAVLLASSQSFSPAELLAGVFPALTPLLTGLGFRVAVKRDIDYVLDTIRAAVETRRRENVTESTDQHRVDLLQLMLDVEAAEAEVKANPDVKCMTTAEIVADGFIFFVAGFETTATALQYMAYLLALHPGAQEKLYSHIIQAVGEAEPSYETVSNIRFLDCCIAESLRMLPPVPIVGRKAAETRTINGVTIPAGSIVAVPIMALMRDEEFFPDAYTFTPERFMDEDHRVPTLVKEMIFGAGPRQCIGMRLALYEVKMAMVSLVRTFKFVKIKETPETINFRKGGLISAPSSPIMIGTEIRQQ